jgi:nucleoid-associated protein YgaU
MTTRSHSPDGNPWMLASIGAGAICIACVVSATRADAADTVPGVAAPGLAGYEQKVFSEAADFVAEGVAEERPVGSPQRIDVQSASPPSGVAAGRVDRIKEAVGQALGVLQTDRASEQMPTRDVPRPDLDPLEARRQALRSLVAEPGEAAVPQESGYLDQLRDEVSETVVFKEAVLPEGEALAPGSRIAADSGPGTYRVQPGDSLWKIAQTKFGNGYEWPRIYDANRKALRNVDVLRIGQVLSIPDR